MRVCVISHILSHTDGQGRVNCAMVAGLVGRGHQVVLVGSELDPPLRDHPNVTWARAAVPRRLPTALLKEQVFAWRARRAVLREARRGGPFDVVQMNGCAAYYPADVCVAMFVHADWMKSPHHAGRVRGGLYGLYQRAYTWLNTVWERRAFRRARVAVSISKLITNSLVNEIGLDPKGVPMIVPGVDAQEFRPLAPGEPNALRRSLGVPDGELLLVFAGDARLNRKNLDLVLNGMAAAGGGCHLAVAGRVAQGVYPAMAERLGIAGRVHFLGLRPDLPDVMRCGDVFAFPSHYDPFALVVTEAMASGLVPIVGPVVGAASVIRSGENGFVLADSADLDGFVALLKRLDADRDGLARMAAAARSTAEGLSWDAMAAQYEAVYRDVAASKRRELDRGVRSASTEMAAHGQVAQDAAGSGVSAG